MSTLPTPDKKHGYVQAMFDAIAPRYDLLNGLLSLRLHHRWRRLAADRAALKPGDCALDVCTGTGDFAIELARRVGAGGQVLASDYSAGMLALGKRKMSPVGQIATCLADAQALPFADSRFDATVVGFGIRNVADVSAAISEMVRVTKLGGRIVILEFALPKNAFIGALYRLYSFKVMPVLGGLISGRRDAYTYLPGSIRAFQSREELSTLMRAAGLVEISVTDLCLGTVAIHTGVKTVQ